MTDTEVLAAVGAEPPDNEDLPGALRATAPRRWRNRATPALLGVFLLAGGFLGGVLVQKHWGKTTTSQTATSTGRSSEFAGQMPGGGASGGPGAFGSPGTTTSGTLKSVTTGTLTMQTAAGKTVTVKILESAKIQQTTTIAQLKAGRSLTVQGTTGTDGAITATAVTMS